MIVAPLVLAYVARHVLSDAAIEKLGDQEFQQPISVSRATVESDGPHIVKAFLDVRFSTVDVKRFGQDGKVVTDRVRLRTYNGEMTAKMIEVRPGNRLRVALTNSIPKTEPDKPFIHNRPNGFNITNLHTHGLHVSPEGRSDNVYLEIGKEEGVELEFDIPDDHYPGTFWFHAHRHGSTALQLSSGMAGALIVRPGKDGGIDKIPEIEAAMKKKREQILVFQQLKYSMNADGVGEVKEKDVYSPDSDTIAVTLINGKHYPLIKMKKGEVQRWRCIHAGLANSLKLALEKTDGKEQLPLYEIAADGLPLYRMECRCDITLHPGYRSDFLVEAPKNAGTYELVGLQMTAAENFTKTARAKERLAVVEVDGEGDAMKLPDPDAIKDFALKPIEDDELFNRKPVCLRFKADGNNFNFTVNGLSFDPDRDDMAPRVGTSEEWALISEKDPHPFHIHVNPFEIVEKKNGKVISKGWKDTILVDETNNVDNPLFIRMRFKKFTGKTVLHCHNLEHEDQGMMLTVRILGPEPAPCKQVKTNVGFSPLPAKAPAWALLDANNQPHSLNDSAGQNRIVIFFRGLGCAHCRRQIELLAQKKAFLAAAKIDVIAISPESIAEMRDAMETDATMTAIPFLLVSDPRCDVFRRYHCFDGRALHGTFLVDKAGMIRWQDVGDDPYMNIDELLKLTNAVFD